MIGKAKACQGGAALANYVTKTEKGYELMRNGLCGDSPTEILREMQPIQDLNQRATNRTFSLVLSPEKFEGQFLLNDKKLRELTKDFMEELKINPQEQQFLAFVHTEKEHKHIHIIANRVNDKGKLLSDHHIGKRAQWAAHWVARKHGVISAKEKQIQNLKKLSEKERQIKGIRKTIKSKHDWVMKQQPKSVQLYIQMMSKLNVKVTPVYNKYSDKLQGLRIKDKESGMDFKASEVHRSMSLNKVMETGIPFEMEEYDEAVEGNKINSNSFLSSATDFLNALGAQQQQEEDEFKKRRKRKRGKGRNNPGGPRL